MMIELTIVALVVEMCGMLLVMYTVRMFNARRLDLEPNPGGALEPGSKGNLHDTVSLL